MFVLRMGTNRPESSIFNIFNEFLKTSGVEFMDLYIYLKSPVIPSVLICRCQRSQIGCSSPFEASLHNPFAHNLAASHLYQQFIKQYLHSWVNFTRESQYFITSTNSSVLNTTNPTRVPIRAVQNHRDPDVMSFLSLNWRRRIETWQKALVKRTKVYV